MDTSHLFKNGEWVIEDANHHGLSVRIVDGGYVLDAWVENWDTITSWEARISDDEFAVIAATPSKARDLLTTERMWHVRSPYRSYVKEGRLELSDSFDGGYGGKW